MTRRAHRLDVSARLRARDPLRDVAWRAALTAARAIPKPAAAFNPGSNPRISLAYYDRFYSLLWRTYLARYYAGRLERAGYRHEVVTAARRMGVSDAVIGAALAGEEAA